MSSPKLMLKIWMETSNHNNLTELKEEDFSEETIETEIKDLSDPTIITTITIKEDREEISEETDLTITDSETIITDKEIMEMDFRELIEDFESLY
jgi:hypothetical protein